MNSSVKKQEKPKIHQAKKEYSRSNDSTYYGPTSQEEEEIISSYSSSRGLMADSSDFEIVKWSSTWKGKKMKKQVDTMRVIQVKNRKYQALHQA
eukprot:142766-Ditylum_brightwellii.AAC.1